MLANPSLFLELFDYTGSNPGNKLSWNCTACLLLLFLGPTKTYVPKQSGKTAAIFTDFLQQLVRCLIEAYHASTHLSLDIFRHSTLQLMSPYILLIFAHFVSFKMFFDLCINNPFLLRGVEKCKYSATTVVKTSQFSYHFNVTVCYPSFYRFVILNSDNSKIVGFCGLEL